ncbi:hypothetical protein Tco_1482965 [Tanacetum coccineum]
MTAVTSIRPNLRQLRCQETMGDTIAQTRFESVSKHSNDSLLARGNTLQSDEDRLKLNELMELCTNLQNRVLDLEKTKTTQANEIVWCEEMHTKLRMRGLMLIDDLMVSSERAYDSLVVVMRADIRSSDERFSMQVVLSEEK